MEEFDSNDPERIALSCCGNKHESVCKACFQRVVEVAINDAYFGCCPIICCPIIPQRPVCYDIWSKFVPISLVESYIKLAETTVTQRCSSCDRTKPIYGHQSHDDDTVKPDTIKNTVVYCTNDPDYVLHNDLPQGAIGAALFTDLERYQQFEITIDAFYTLLTNKHLPMINDTDDDRQVWNAMGALLDLLHNPERKATLLLRHMRSHPHIWTQCCEEEHCYSCQIGGFHYDQTCAEYVAENLNDEGEEIGEVEFVACPSCNLTISKGDGCDSMLCVCGFGFSWAEELVTYQCAQRFLRQFPRETDKHSVQIVLEGVDSDAVVVAVRSDNHSSSSSSSSSGGDSSSNNADAGVTLTDSELTDQASGWISRNTSTCHRLLLQYLTQSFPHCAARVCYAYQQGRNAPDRHRYHTDRETELTTFQRVGSIRARAHISNHISFLRQGGYSVGSTNTRFTTHGMDQVLEAFRAGPHGDQLLDDESESNQIAVSSLVRSLFTSQQRTSVLHDSTNATRYGYGEPLRRLYNLGLDKGLGFQTDSDNSEQQDIDSVCNAIAVQLITDNCNLTSAAEFAADIKAGSDAVHQLLWLYGPRPIVFGGHIGVTLASKIASTWLSGNAPSATYAHDTDNCAWCRHSVSDCCCEVRAGSLKMPTFLSTLTYTPLCSDTTSSRDGSRKKRRNRGNCHTDTNVQPPHVFSIRVDQLPFADVSSSLSHHRRHRSRGSLFSVGVTTKTATQRHFPLGFDDKHSYGIAFCSDSHTNRSMDVNSSAGGISNSKCCNLIIVQVLENGQITQETRLSRPLTKRDRIVLVCDDGVDGLDTGDLTDITEGPRLTFGIYRAKPASGSVTEQETGKAAKSGVEECVYTHTVSMHSDVFVPKPPCYYFGVTLPNACYSVSLSAPTAVNSGFTHCLTPMHAGIFKQVMYFLAEYVVVSAEQNDQNNSNNRNKLRRAYASWPQLEVSMEAWAVHWKEQSLIHPARMQKIYALAEPLFYELHKSVIAFNPNQQDDNDFFMQNVCPSYQNNLDRAQVVDRLNCLRVTWREFLTCLVHSCLEKTTKAQALESQQKLQRQSTRCNIDCLLESAPIGKLFDENTSESESDKQGDGSFGLSRLYCCFDTISSFTSMKLLSTLVPVWIRNSKNLLLWLLIPAAMLAYLIHHISVSIAST